MFGRRNPEPAPPTPRVPDEETNLGLLPPDEPPPAPPGVPTLSEVLGQSNTNNDAAPYAPVHRQPERATTPSFAAPANLPEPMPFVPPAESVSARPRAASESVIGPDDFFDGTYRSERGVRIQGGVKGTIESRQYIFVEASAQVEANLSADDITVSGRFNGMIECRRRLEITSSGQVQGQIRTALLVVQEGGVLHGELQMRTSDQGESNGTA